MPLSVVIAGSSGFLGSHLLDELRSRGHEVVRLVRRPSTGGGESTWDPYAGQVDRGLVGGADVVVNLAGSPLIGNPHSEKYARVTRESRVTTTRVLAEVISRAEHPPVFLAGNGISYYGDHGDAVLTEASGSRGDALLTSVARDWEAAARPAYEVGARLVVLRTAPLLDRRVPPLQQLRLLFKAGLGGRVGTGRQYFPVISLRDWVAAVTFAAEEPAVRGPINLCAPDTPTNAEFTRALAAVLHRPAPLPVPAPLIRVAAGKQAPLLLDSINARPEALLRAGYRFRDHDVRAVLTAGLA